MFPKRPYLGVSMYQPPTIEKNIDVPFVEKTHGYFILCTSIPIKVQSLWWSIIHDWTNPAYMSSMTRCNGKSSHWSFGMIRSSLASLTSTLSPSFKEYSSSTGYPNHDDAAADDDDDTRRLSYVCCFISPSNYSYHHRLLGLWTLRSLQMIMVRPFALCAGTSFWNFPAKPMADDEPDRLWVGKKVLQGSYSTPSWQVPTVSSFVEWLYQLYPYPCSLGIP